MSKHKSQSADFHEPQLENGKEDDQNATSAAPSFEEDDLSLNLEQEIETLKKQLSVAQEEIKSHNDKFLRVMAEAENVRRRNAEEMVKARKFALEEFAVELLPVMDSLEATLATENSTALHMREGVEVTLKQLQVAFARCGLVGESPKDQFFDPTRHQAISTQEHQGPPNRVLTVLQKGYLLHGRVLRSALVVVSSAPTLPQS